jgi:hypothetical protein
MMTVEMTQPGADEAACPARGTDDAAFPARCTDEAACPARSAHKDSCLASGASDNDFFQSMSPLTASLIVTTKSWQLNILLFEEKQIDSVSNTPTAQGLYGQSFASDEVIEEAHLHINMHPFRAMKSIINKSSRLASMGKTIFRLDEEEWKAPIGSYLETLIYFDSCFNKKRRYFIKCSCLKSLHILNRAVPYLTKIGGMNKLGQDAFSKSCSTAASVVQVDTICE